MLELKNIWKSFGDKNVIKDLSLKFAPSEVVCVLGPSGCGKSTLMNLSSGLLSPDKGVVEKSAFQSSFIFQENRLLPWLNCIENITYTGAEKSKALKYLDLVGLANDALQKPTQLSGGMQRRLAIARSLAFSGDFYFIDEPLQGLDMTTSESMTNLIKSELKNKAALIITHSGHDAFAFADRILIAKGLPFEIVYDLRKDDFSSAKEISSLFKEIKP